MTAHRKFQFPEISTGFIDQNPDEIGFRLDLFTKIQTKFSDDGGDTNVGGSGGGGACAGSGSGGDTSLV